MIFDTLKSLRENDNKQLFLAKKEQNSCLFLFSKLENSIKKAGVELSADYAAVWIFQLWGPCFISSNISF